MQKIKTSCFWSLPFYRRRSQTIPAIYIHRHSSHHCRQNKPRSVQRSSLPNQVILFPDVPPYSTCVLGISLRQVSAIFSPTQGHYKSILSGAGNCLIHFYIIQSPFTSAGSAIRLPAPYTRPQLIRQHESTRQSPPKLVTTCNYVYVSDASPTKHSTCPAH